MTDTGIYIIKSLSWTLLHVVADDDSILPLLPGVGSKVRQEG
jgi:hypothetical protein